MFSICSKARVASIREVLKDKTAYCTFCLKQHEKGLLSHYIIEYSLIQFHVSLKSSCGLPVERTSPKPVERTRWMIARVLPSKQVFSGTVSS